MKTLFLLAFVIGVAYCAPQLMYYELEYKPVLAPQALPAGAARPSEVEILLAAQQAAAGVPAQPVRGFIKHEIPQPGGRESVEVLYPFDFSQTGPAAPAVPAVPAVPAIPAVPAVPAIPAVPAVPAAPAPVPKDDDDDDHDD